VHLVEEQDDRHARPAPIECAQRLGVAYPVLTIIPIGAISCRQRSQSRVARSAIACDAQAAGRSALDGDLARLKTGAPGGWPFPARSRVGGRDGGRPATDGARGNARAAARRAPQVLRRSCQSGCGECPGGRLRLPRRASCVISPAAACDLVRDHAPDGAPRASGAVPAGAPPLPPPSGDVIEVERTVIASGNVSIGNHVISAGSPLAGQRVTVRLDGPVAHILADGAIVRTIACPLPLPARHRLRGARAGTAGPPQLAVPLTVRRRVSIRGAIMIGGQRIQVGLLHAGKTAEITVGSDIYQITAEDGVGLTAPRTTSRDIKRHKASDYQPG